MTAPPERPLVLAVALDAEVAEARDRAPVGLSGRDLLVTIVASAGFVAGASALAATAPSFEVSRWYIVVFVAAYAVVSQIEFEIGSGVLVPTQLLLVPMLFVFPPGWVPLLVAAGLVVGASFDLARGKLHPSRLLVSLVYSSHALGPAFVLSIAGVERPAWSDWRVLLLALVAGFGADVLSTLVREVIGVGVDPKLVLAGMGQVYVMDSLLTPVAFLAALAGDRDPLAALAVVPLAALFRVLAFERQARIDRTVELSDAVAEVGRVARTDALTGVANRLAWEEELFAMSAFPSAGVVIADVDGLKHVNDRHGHDLGDALIRAVAVTLEETVGSDARLIARLGGDEFGLLFNSTDLITLDRFVTEIRGGLDRRAPLRGGVLVSASVGACVVSPSTNLDKAIEEADRRVYAEKIRRGVHRERRRDAMESHPQII